MTRQTQSAVRPTATISTTSATRVQSSIRPSRGPRRARADTACRRLRRAGSSGPPPPVTADGPEPAWLAHGRVAPVQALARHALVAQREVVLHGIVRIELS